VKKFGPQIFAMDFLVLIRQGVLEFRTLQDLRATTEQDATPGVGTQEFTLDLTNKTKIMHRDSHPWVSEDDPLFQPVRRRPEVEHVFDR
jgi:hypothetical protein